MSKHIASPGRTKKILEENNLRLSKKLGQNFLIDRNIIDIIVAAADIKESDTVIEIGPGIGSLTEGILEKIPKGKLIAIEKDSRLVTVLNNLFDNDNLEIINIDVLEIEWQKFMIKKDIHGDNIKLMANLPYYITTPIIMGLLENKVPIDKFVFMVQKEVAERMAASPGGKDYGALSIAVQYYTKAEIIHNISSNVFIPRPAVDSAVIRLSRRKEAEVILDDEDFFFKIVRAVFQQRRKNIKNALSKAANINIEKDVVINCLEDLDIDPRIRGEKLSIKKFAELSNAIYRKM
ncbi:16S rRNA (adenine(1518)-N(6)/adenine(1519)-N(6))-dimethyltransferase RsmA [Natronospora cellulosivora (SeqCode)]